MKQFIKENKAMVIAWLVLTLLFVSFGYITIEQNKAIDLAKKELFMVKNTKHSSEIISETILDKKNNIKVTETNIKILEEKKNKLELEVTCWKNQMNRLVDGLEYNLDYCKDETNLSKFKEDFQ